MYTIHTLCYVQSSKVVLDERDQELQKFLKGLQYCLLYFPF